MKVVVHLDVTAGYNPLPNDPRTVCGREFSGGLKSTKRLSGVTCNACRRKVEANVQLYNYAVAQK